MSRRRSPGALIAHLLLIAGGAIVLLPFAWMVLISLKTVAEVFAPGLVTLPDGTGATANYRRALLEGGMLRALLNGALVCGCILFLQLALAVPAGYALARLRFRGSGTAFTLVLAALLIPVQVPALPIYLGLAGLGLLDTYAALILPFAASAFGIFLFRQFFLAFPPELIEAARLDGCTEFGILRRIALPNAWPPVAAFSVISVAAHWNDLYWPLIVVTRPDLATPPLAVVYFRNEEAGSDFGALMAAATIAALPLLIVFLFAQRRFVQGITTTGLR